MRTTLIGLILATATLLVACASSRPRYQDWTQSDAATLTIRTTATNHRNIHVVSHGGEDYLQSKGEVITLLNSIAIGFEFSDKKTIKVRPGNEFRFSTLVGGHEFVGIDKIKSTVCMTHTAFQPVAGGIYVAVHELSPTGCSMTIMRDFGGTLINEPTAVQLPACLDPSLGMSGFATACKEGFKFR